MLEHRVGATEVVLHALQHRGERVPRDAALGRADRPEVEPARQPLEASRRTAERAEEVVHEDARHHAHRVVRMRRARARRQGPRVSPSVVALARSCIVAAGREDCA
ncbi:hypothetical protein DB32_000870 [Sandaracinus amylolyticus]|uniref:Uncharacterized protein n=1 Tax=Sandaracinus amylolyticus TaxID=927083 RepID=A0A0F6VZY3_9BACT|nr:hypothetical protein DB32_000870 [Sandaracinus amylolyticus]